MLTVIADFLRFAFFRRIKGNVADNWIAYLAVGLAITWLVGFGRTWDFDAAPLWLRTGLPSIGYVFVLAAIIWAVVLGLRPARWSYKSVLLMVTMTAAPGVIYAAPVERILAADTARGVNMLFLLVVATWRMALYYKFLRDVALLPSHATLVAWLLPPTLVVAPLSLFGLLGAIARDMGGVRETVDPGEISGGAIMFIAAASWLLLPVLLVSFVVFVIQRNRSTPTTAAKESNT